jgi:hypothetical protein
LAHHVQAQILITMIKAGDSPTVAVCIHYLETQLPTGNHGLQLGKGLIAPRFLTDFWGVDAEQAHSQPAIVTVRFNGITVEDMTYRATQFGAFSRQGSSRSF